VQLIKMFEDRLKQMTPDAPKITYDVQDLFRYLDNLHDVAALSLDQAMGAYVPMDKEALKNGIYEHLKNAASGGGGGGGSGGRQGGGGGGGGGGQRRGGGGGGGGRR
jgi:hypothetical protein